MTATIRLEPGGVQFSAQPNETVLEAGLRSGIALPYRCTNGSCGQCKARVRSGRVREVRFHDFTLGEAERGLGYHLLCCVAADSDVVLEASEVDDAADVPHQSIAARVHKLQRLGEDLLLMQVRTPRQQTLAFLAGQSVRLTLPGLLPRYRAIASCPCNGVQLEFHIRRVPGDAFSEYAFGYLKPSHPITVEGPEGEFTFDGHSGRPAVFFAYDTGFAPIKSLIEHAISLDGGQPMRLYWMALRRGEHYLDNLCRSWCDALDDFVYQPLTSLIESGQEQRWSELTALERVVQDTPDLSAWDLYVVGSQGLVATARKRFTEAGLPPERFFAETLKYF